MMVRQLHEYTKKTNKLYSFMVYELYLNKAVNI